MNKNKIIDAYTVTGVPMSSLPQMCKDLNINYDKLVDWLRGQTTGVVNGEAMVYPYDLKRYVGGLPVIDKR